MLPVPGASAAGEGTARPTVERTAAQAHMHSVRVITQDHLHFQDKLEPNDEHAIARMVARPPQTPRSDAGSVAGSESRGSSRLSVASRSNLEGLQGRQKITTLIEIKVQMDATASGKSLGKHARHRLHKTAKHQAHGVLAECHMDLDGLPGKMGPGCFRPGSMPAQLAAAISEAAVITALAINAPPPPTTPAPIEEDPEPIAAPEPEPSKIFERERRLPAINVAGKMVPLETVIRDKVMARGGGGAHQLRKMFQVFDTDGTGTVTAIEMDCFLRHNNIKINNKSLAKFFETWASERQRGDMEMKGIDDGDNSSVSPLAPATASPSRPRSSPFANKTAHMACIRSSTTWSSSRRSCPRITRTAKTCTRMTSRPLRTSTARSPCRATRSPLCASIFRRFRRRLRRNRAVAERSSAECSRCST